MTNISVLMALCATYTSTSCRPKSVRTRVSKWTDIPSYLELYGSSAFMWDIQVEHCDYDQLSLVSRYPIYANVALTCLDTDKTKVSTDRTTNTQRTQVNKVSTCSTKVNRTVLVVKTKEDQAHDLATSVWNVSLDLAGRSSFSYPLVESQGVIRQLYVSAKCGQYVQAEVIASVTSFNSTNRRNRTPLDLTNSGCEAAAIEAPTPEPSPQATPVPQIIVVRDTCVNRYQIGSIIRTQDDFCLGVVQSIFVQYHPSFLCTGQTGLLNRIPSSCFRNMHTMNQTLPNAGTGSQCAYNISVQGSPQATLALDNDCENETMRDVCDYLFSMCDVSIDHEPIDGSANPVDEWPMVRTYNVYRSIRKRRGMNITYNGTMRAQSVSPGFENASAINIVP